MKKALWIIAFLVLAAQLPLQGLETSPSTEKIIPEVIWAAATGGGTWVTELQITNFSSTAIDLAVEFYYNGGGINIALHDDLAPYHSLRYPNILAELQALNPSFNFYGRVGALYILSDGLIQAQAKTVNGNYGKTFPGLNILSGTTAALNRPMIIQDLVRSSAYRTSVGVFNWNTTGQSFTVFFRILDANNNTVGSPFAMMISHTGFVSFNPFVAAGVTSGTYENCWLYIEVTTGTSPSNGLMCYGSIANNYTNDTYALLAKQYGSTPPPSPGP